MEIEVSKGVLVVLVVGKRLLWPMTLFCSLVGSDP